MQAAFFPAVPQLRKRIQFKKIMRKINLLKKISSAADLTEEEKGLMRTVFLLPIILASLFFLLSPLILYLSD